jgi:hypothetical protein
MRCVLVAVALLLLNACGSPPAAPDPAAGAPPRDAVSSYPLAELRFNDERLQAAADNLIQRARLRRVEACVGRTRIEGLLWLEASVGTGSTALWRVNELVFHLTASDASRWADLRRQAEKDFRGRGDAAAVRVRDLLGRWTQEKSVIAFRFLSSNYDMRFISSDEWERRFHDFVAAKPMDAATWAWLVRHVHGDAVRRQYGRADDELAYRYYLELAHLGDGREAREVFSVPGIEIEGID